MGMGNPVTGNNPVTTAALTNAYKIKLKEIPTARKTPNGSVHSFATLSPRKKNKKEKRQDGNGPQNETHFFSNNCKNKIRMRRG